MTIDIGLDVLGCPCVMSRRGSRLSLSVRKGSRGQAELQGALPELLGVVCDRTALMAI